jgi:acylphosphatase
VTRGPEVVRKRVVVDGRVQGVGFRASCAGQARAHGVAGSVRNRPDGRVEAVFEGAGDAVDAVVTWCERGPAYARVSSVQVFDEPPLGETGFRIA